MGDSDEENEAPVDAAAAARAALPPVTRRKIELREDLFEQILFITVAALKKHKLQKDIAQEIKQNVEKDPQFNELIGKGPWQVIVGRSFAASVTHEAMHVAFFDIPAYQAGPLAQPGGLQTKQHWN